MGYLESIDKRVSRRDYLRTPIEAGKRDTLKQLIDHCNAEGGLSIEWIEDGAAAFQNRFKTFGFFSGVRTILAMKGPKNDPDLYEKLGFYGELIVLEATGLGLGSCWVGGTFDRGAKALAADEGEVLALVITIGHVEPEMTRRERMVHGMTHRKRKPIGQLFSADERPPKWFMRGVRAAGLAPSARNRQPVRFVYREGVATASAEGDGALTLVDLGIAKCHFAVVAGGVFGWGQGADFSSG